MKHFVITILDNPQSVKIADRCIASGAKNNLAIRQWMATTPDEHLAKKLDDAHIKQAGFEEKYSRLENCMAAFHSHYSLWQHCVQIDEEITIFEHDAVVVDNIPNNLTYMGVVNLGKPSYGKWSSPKSLGMNPLTSKRYFPGAHAYRVNPVGARTLITQARVNARPTDVFLNLDVFPYLQEYFPWPVEARDTFTTIQKTEGCLAKHGYNENYKII